jgi:hypothetical protein
MDGFDGDRSYFRNKMNPKLEVLRYHAEGLAQMLRNRRANLIVAMADKYMNDAGKAMMRGAIDRQARERSEQLYSLATGAKADLERIIAEMLHVDLAPDAMLARETRAARLWARFRDLLDSGAIDALGLVEREAANLDALEVLIEELPDWLATKGAPDAVAAAVLGRAEEHATPHLSPTMRLAREMRKELATGWVRLQTAQNYAEAELESNTPWNVLPAWESGDKVVHVA